MIYKIILLLVLLYSQEGCLKSQVEYDKESPISDTEAELEISATATGETDIEKKIDNLNFYIFSTRTGAMSGHLYRADGESGSFRRTLAFGDYEAYVIANAGKDLGEEMTPDSLIRLRYSLSEIPETLPMFGSCAIMLSEDTEQTIELKRCTAKVVFSVSVSEALSGMQIQSIQLKNVGESNFYVAKDTAAGYVTDFQIEHLTGEEMKSFTRTYYITENCAGENSLIKRQQDKSSMNAPSNATYFLINALRENRFCTYRIFLGENNTSDFNVKRNTIHYMNISIEGEDEVDTRMDMDDIVITDNFHDIDLRIGETPYCIAGTWYKLSFEAVNDNLDTYSADLTLTKGERDSFSLNGIQGDSIYHLDLGKLDTETFFPIGYSPKVIDSSNMTLSYMVTIRSGKGNVYTEKLQSTFCNLLTIYSSYPSLGFEKGGSVETSAQRKDFDLDDMNYSYIFSCQPTVSLKAICDDGFSFDGWYSALNDGTCISKVGEMEYSLKSSSSDVLAAKFKRTSYYIYTDLNSVELTSHKHSEKVDYLKNAYIVDTAAICMVYSKDSEKEIEGWYDSPTDQSESHLIANGNVYQFTPEKNMYIYPKFSNY